MNEQKRLYIILGIIAAIIVLILGINFYNEYKSKTYLKTFDSAITNGEKQLILVGRGTCVYCQMFTPLLEYMKEQYGFDYLYVNTDKITQKGLNQVLDKLNINADDFGTPHLSLVENGQVLDEISGYVDEKELLMFLKNNGYAPEDAVLPLNYITFEDYKNLINSDTPEIIVIGQTSCSACMRAKPSLLEIASKYNLKINYFNITEELYSSENSTELIAEFNSSLSFLTEEQWGTPLMIIVKNKEVIANSKGFLSTNNYISFFKEHGIIGE